MPRWPGPIPPAAPLGRLQVNAAANRPADVRVAGILQDLPADPHWQARAVGRQVWFPVFHDGWPRLMLDATVDAPAISAATTAPSRPAAPSSISMISPGPPPSTAAAGG